MTKVSNKMISSLLAVIMVLGVMAMPVLPALEAEAAVVPDPMGTNYVWDFDNSIINPDVQPVVYNGVQRGKYENGELVNFINNYFGEVKNGVTGGEYDSYIKAGSNGVAGTKSKISIVDNGLGGKALRITTTDIAERPYIAVEFPEAITGVADVEFEARLGKISSGEFVPLETPSRGRLFAVNTVDGKPNVQFDYYKLGHSFVNSNFVNTVGCTVCGTKEKGIIATNVFLGNFKKYKMLLNYTDGYANAYRDGSYMLSCGEHATEFAISGTGMNRVYFFLEMTTATLAEGEAIVCDIDSIKISVEPKPLDAVKTLGDWDFENSTLNTEHAIYDEENENIDLSYFTVNPGKDIIIGGENDSLIYAANTENYSGKVSIVTEDDNKMLRIENEAGAGSPYVKIAFPETVKGVVDVEFDARVSKKTADGLVAANMKTKGIFFAVNNFTTSGKPYFNFSSNNSYTNNGEIIVNDQWGTGSICQHSGCSTHGKVLGYYNFDSGLNGYKLTLDYDNGYANAYKLDGSLRMCGTDHVSKYAVSGTGLNSLYFHVPMYGTLEEGETFVIDIDNIKVTTTPIVSAPVANVANGGDNVAIDKVFEVDFGMDITQSEYDGVNLLDAAGVEVQPVNKKVVGSKVVIAPVDELDYGTDYKLTIPEIKRNGADGYITYPAQTVEFTTSETVADLTISANLYDALDTEFTTPLEALTENTNVKAVVDFTGDATVDANNVIMYIGVYNAGGNLLLATASESDVEAGATEQLTSTFTVPAGADHIKIFAWNKHLTPHSVPKILFD